MDYDKIEKFFARETPNIKDILFIKNEDGSYNLFGKYNITSTADGNYNVCYNGNPDVEPITFASLKNAVTWCLYNRNNKYKDIKRIQELDVLISGSNVTISALKNRIVKSKNSEDKLIYMAKLSEEQTKQKAMIVEINSYIETSRNWQHKKFENLSPK